MKIATHLRTRSFGSTLGPALAAVFLVVSPGWASNWNGTNANWNSNAATGWNGTGMPSNFGDIANFGVAATGTTTVNITGITIGTLSLTNNSNNSRIITLTNSLTFNQDGALAGRATILNSNTFAGTLNFLSLSAGTLTLNDDLLIENSGASTNGTGAIQITSTIGGSGSVTFRNTSTALSQTSSIRIQTAANTFDGAVFIESGTVTYNNAASFGNAANVITIGASGMGKANLLSTAGVVVANPIVVAAGAGDTLTLGALGTGSAGYSGIVTLDGSLTITSAVTNAAGLNFSSEILGDGGITKAGTGILTFSAANTYTGDTVLAPGSGTLLLKNTNALAHSTLNYTGSALVFDASVVSKNFVFGGLKGSANIALQNNAGVPAAIALFIGNNDTDTSATPYTGTLSGAGRLEKAGTGITKLTGPNTYTGTTTVADGTLTFGTRASLYNATPASWTNTNLIVATGATLAFGVGDGSGFTSPDVDQLVALGTTIGGFKDGSLVGFDTTAGNFTYNSAIQNPNAGANAIGLAKFGENKLSLGNISTFTGPVVVHKGELELMTLAKLTGNGDITIKEGATFTLKSTETLALGTSHIYLEEGTFAIDTIGAVDLNNDISGHGFFSVREGTVNFGGNTGAFDGTFLLNDGATFVPGSGVNLSAATLILTPGTTLDLRAFGDVAIGRLEGSGILKGNNITIYDISAYNPANFDTTDVSGYVAVPEPRDTAVAVALLLGFVIYMRRSR